MPKTPGQGTTFTGFSIATAVLLILAAPGPLGAQPGAAAGPPAVGVVEAVRRPIKNSEEFVGRVQAVHRVELLARVTAFLNERHFDEGSEVRKGDLLYRLERAPFEAEVIARQATVAQAEAELINAKAALGRARELRSSGTGTQVALDNATAQERSAAAQLLAAQAQLRQAEINLGYTEIRAPIDGRIGRTAVTIGNVVGPNTGPLAAIVSQDPMYVTFPMPMPTALELRTRYAPRGGFEAVVIKLLLPDGRLYEHPGRLGFIDTDVGQQTDTITLRGTIPNPLLHDEKTGGARLRELFNGEFVTVILEAAEPVQALVVPREAVLSDQQGDFVYIVGADNRVQRRPVQLGQSTSETAAITAGLQEGDKVVLEGVQRVQPGTEVSPGPADLGLAEAADTANAPAPQRGR